MTGWIYPPAVRMTRPACDIRDDGTVAILLDAEDYSAGHIIIDDTDTSLALAQAAMDAHEALAARQRAALAAEVAQPRYVPEEVMPHDAAEYGAAGVHMSVPRPGIGAQDEDPAAGHTDPPGPGTGPGHQDPPGGDAADGQPAGPGDGGERGDAATAAFPAEAPIDEPTCLARDGNWACTASPGHDGEHTAHGAGGDAVHTWRQEVTL